MTASAIAEFPVAARVNKYREEQETLQETLQETVPDTDTDTESDTDQKQSPDPSRRDDGAAPRRAGARSTLQQSAVSSQ